MTQTANFMKISLWRAANPKAHIQAGGNGRRRDPNVDATSWLGMGNSPAAQPGRAYGQYIVK